MAKYKIELEIAADNEAEARRKAKAAASISAKLTAVHFEKLAVAANDPATLSLALDFLGD